MTDFFVGCLALLWSLGSFVVSHLGDLGEMLVVWLILDYVFSDKK